MSDTAFDDYTRGKNGTATVHSEESLRRLTQTMRAQGLQETFSLPLPRMSYLVTDRSSQARVEYVVQYRGTI